MTRRSGSARWNSGMPCVASWRAGASGWCAKTCKRATAPRPRTSARPASRPTPASRWFPAAGCWGPSPSAPARARSFSEDELELMQTVADQAAVAVERKRAHDELRQRGAELEERAHLLDLAHVFVQRFRRHHSFLEPRRGGDVRLEPAGGAGQERRTNCCARSFRSRVEEIRRAVREQGSWAGELVQTRRDGTQVVAASHWLLHRGSGDGRRGHPGGQQRHYRGSGKPRRPCGRARSVTAPWRSSCRCSCSPPIREGQRDFVNQRWCDYTGLDVAEGVERRWLATVHPDDREAVERKWDEAVASGTVFEAQYRVRGQGRKLPVVSEPQPAAARCPRAHPQVVRHGHGHRGAQAHGGGRAARAEGGKHRRAGRGHRPPLQQPADGDSGRGERGDGQPAGGEPGTAAAGRRD